MGLLNLHDVGILPTNSGQQNTAAWNAAIAAFNSDGLYGGFYLPTAGPYNLCRNYVLGEKVHPIRLKGLRPFDFVGEKSILKLVDAPYGDNGDTHIIWTDHLNGNGEYNFRGLVLDGGYPGPDPATGNPPASWGNDQLHGLYIGGMTGSTGNVNVDNLEIRNVRGDCIYVISDKSQLPPYPLFQVNRLNIRDCFLHDTGRSGIAFQRKPLWIVIEGCHITRVQDATIDSEISGPNDGRAPQFVRIANNNFEHDGDSLCVALTGNSNADPMRWLQFVGNTIHNGALFLGMIEHALIEGNLIEGDIHHRAIEGYLYCHDFLVQNNIIHSHSGIDGIAAVHFEGGAGLGASDITIQNNHIYQHVASRHGVSFRGDIAGISVINNPVIRGAGGGFGVSFDLTAGQGHPHKSFKVRGNNIRNFGAGVLFGTDDGNTPYESVHIANDYEDMPIGVYLNTRGGTLPGLLNLRMGNAYTNVTKRVENPGGRQKFWSTGEERYCCYGSPEGLIAAPVGHEATRLDGPAGQLVYRKTSGSGSSGWTAVH